MTERFAVGATAVRRDTVHGQIWTAAPYRVVRDTGDELVLCCWPGTRSLVPTSWIQWLRTGDESARDQAVPNQSAGRWELGEWTWGDTTLVIRLTPGEYFSVQRFTGPGRAHEDGGFYVNFERPFRRTAIGIDTADLGLDLLVAPDLSSHRWKDEREYAHARRVGLIDEATHQEVERARQRVLGMIDDGIGPFAGDWRSVRVAADWAIPELPDDALSVPISD